MQPKPDNRTLGLVLSGHLREFDWESLAEKDWNQFNQRALSEGVAPLLYWMFSTSGMLRDLPPTSRNFYRVAYAGTWMRNQGYLKELHSLSQMFALEKIAFVLLKGICYILTIYPDIGLRPMGDMDLLVPRLELKKAVALAKSLDFEETLPEASPGLKDLLNHEVCLQKKGAVPMTLELHHSLVADGTFTYAVPVDWFWEHTESLGTPPASSALQDLLILSPTAQVLYATSHAMLQHGGQDVPLCWYYDLDRLIHQYGARLDWEKLLYQATIFEWGSALNAALMHAYTYFHTPIPGNVLARLSGSTDRHSQLVALKQNAPATHTLKEYQKLLSLNWYGRLRLVMALVFPSPAYMMWRYGLGSNRQLIVRYPVRWWNIVKDVFRTVWMLVGKHA